MYFASTYLELEFITHPLPGSQLSGLDKDPEFEGLTCFAVWQMLHLCDFLNAFCSRFIARKQNI